MGIGPWQIAIILIIVLIVFGGGKLPKVMGDIGKGVRNMKNGLKGDEDNKKSGDDNTPNSSAASIDNNSSSEANLKESKTSDSNDKK